MPDPGSSGPPTPPPTPPPLTPDGGRVAPEPNTDPNPKSK
jgi:hypothetical protein